MAKLNYFNNTGGLNKFSSVASLNESEKNTDWFDAQNVEGHKSGGIIKMKGNINVCNTVLPPDTKILGIFDYIKGSEHYPVINTSEGKLYRFNLALGTLTQIYSGLNTTSKCCYVNFNNGVIMTNGVDIPVFYEESIGASVLGGTPPVGLPIEVYKARVFIASGSALHYSALGNQNDWTTPNDAGYIANFHNDSSTIIALKNYGEYLAIYKKNSIYILSGTSPADFSITPVSNIGSISTYSVGTVDNDQYFFNGKSITPLRFNELGQVRLADDTSIKIKPVFDELDYTKFNQVICIPYQKKNQIWFYFSQNHQDLNVCYIYDYFHRSWFKRVGVPVSCGAVINGNIYTGTSDGRILIEDVGDNFDGDAIEAWWFSPWFTFGAPGVNKEIVEFDIWIYQDQKYPVEILYSRNYSGQDKKYISVNVSGNDDMLWDNGFWDQDSWSSSKAVRKKIRINGKCESLQIGIRNLYANQPFAVLGYSFEV